MDNRSTGFDSECDLSFRLESAANRAAAQGLRVRLVAHWLGWSPALLDEAVARTGRLGSAIDTLRGDARLQPIEPRPLGLIASFIAAFHIGDPVGPADSFRLGLRCRRFATEAAAAGSRELDAV
jgi:hypothetical protein